MTTFCIQGSLFSVIKSDKQWSTKKNIRKGSCRDAKTTKNQNCLHITRPTVSIRWTSSINRPENMRLNILHSQLRQFIVASFVCNAFHAELLMMTTTTSVKSHEWDQKGINETTFPHFSSLLHYTMFLSYPTLFLFAGIFILALTVTATGCTSNKQASSLEWVSKDERCGVRGYD